MPDIINYIPVTFAAGLDLQVWELEIGVRLPSGSCRLVFVVQDRLTGTLGASEVEFKVE